jgi:hypothetical protein
LFLLTYNLMSTFLVFMVCFILVLVLLYQADVIGRLLVCYLVIWDLFL